MNFKELFEGAEPKLPGAPKGIQIMTPQQFVAKSAEGEEPEPNEELDENLRQWFKEKWVRFGPDGKIRGDCARGDDSEGKPKCLPQAKAHALGKKGRKYAAAKKRREDPNPERRGPAKNVATKKKTNEQELDEACWKGYHKEGNKKMFGKTYPNCVKNTNEEQELEESVQLDEGALSKIGSVALGLALAFGAGKSMAEEMYVYQDSATQKLRLVRHKDRIPSDALMSFKVDTDSKSVSMIKGNQVVPVQVQPEVVKQAQQQASVTQKPNTQGQNVQYGMSKQQVKQLIPNLHDAEEAGTVQGKLLAQYGIAKTQNILLSGESKILDANAEVFYEFKNNKLDSVHYIISMRNLGMNMGGISGYDRAEFKEIVTNIFDKISKSGIIGTQTSKIKIETLNTIGGLVDNLMLYGVSADFSKGDILALVPGQTGIVNNFRPGHIIISKKLSSPTTNESQQCPHCGGPMFSEMFIAEKKDACYYKVKSRYKVWPSAYASGALVKCRKKGASNWGTGGKSNESVDEATKLAAPTRPIGDPELTDYLDRIRKQEKKKTDKYKLPYIHRSSVMGYYSEDGKKYNVDAIKAALKERPKALLKKNEKMKHSDGEQEQFFNIGFAALVGIALDENTNELIIVNTCPGAGSCKIDCFAMKGGKVQFQGPWLSDGRILTYLLNDPEGFFNQLKADISKEEMKGKKGGYKVSIRWHDAGDFFSPEYASMAFKLAESLPEVDFYAYTKVAGVALGDKPKNFMINWSEGASASQEKQVKGADSDLSKTKNSRIVPTSLFYDLLVKDEKKNLVKGPEGQWQVIPDKLPELKQRLAKEYGLSANSILSYSEWESKAKGKDKSPLKYNVIITPGEPDLTAKDAGVLSTLLLKH